MKLPAFITATLLLFNGAAAQAGDIKGTIHAQGAETDSADDQGGAYASRKYKFAERVNYDEMKDFVVSIDGPVDNVERSTNRAVIVTQQNATFNPRILPIAVGTTVEWPNRDDIFHNVFSFSDPKPFDLGLYKDEMKLITFDQPGRIDVFCSIHKNMHCIILVLENPFFDQTDDRGRFTIKNVPAGTYKIKAWHERMPPQIKEITVPADGNVTVDFTMGITGLPKY